MGKKSFHTGSKQRAYPLGGYSGMSLGGWLSGEIYDYTNSYSLAFLNGIFWNIINLIIMVYLFFIYLKAKKTMVIK